MTVIAYDMPASGATADALIATRTATCGLPWVKFASNAPWAGAAGWRIDASDSAAGTCKGLATSGAPGLAHFAQSMVGAGAIWRAHQRFYPAATAGGMLAIGFIDASGNGYFGGQVRNTNEDRLYRLAGATGVLTQLGTIATPSLSASNTYLYTLEYNPTTRALRLLLNGAQRLAVTNNLYSPIYPAILTHEAGTGFAPNGSVVDVLFEGVDE